MRTNPGEADGTRRPRHRTRSTRSERIALTIEIAVAIALVVLLSDAAPTGHWIVDALYRAVFATATVLAGARARRWNLLVAAALVAVGSDGWMLVPAAVALVLGLLMAWRDRRDRVLGGAAGALVAWAALGLSWPASPTGATALLAAAAVVPLWVSGYRNARRPTRRGIRNGLIGAVAIGLLGVLAAAGFALTQRTTLIDAAESTVDAAASITSSSGEADTQVFEDNRAAFASVAHAATAWWMTPTRLVPVVSQHVRAVQVAATSGAELNSFAAELSKSVDYDRLQRDDGSIDLALLAEFAAPVTAANTTLARVESELGAIGSPWLLPPLADQLSEFTTEVQGAGSATAVADAAVRHLPGILGADGPRRYLLLLGNPAESRDLGGHLGNWAELVVTDGKIDVTRVGVPYELFAPWTEPSPVLPDDTGLPPSLIEMQPERFPQNWGSSPDMATVERLARGLYPQAAGGAPIDGVLYADPVAFAALLRLTGPVEAGGVRLTPDNAVEYLTRDQFLTPVPQEAPVSDLIRVALDQLTGNRLPGTEQITSAFSDVVGQGHLQFLSGTSSENELMALVGLDQPLPEPAGSDVVAVISRNANPSKIDAYLHRTIDYDVEWDPATGRVRSRVVVTLRNDAPPQGLPAIVIGSAVALPPGTNRTQLAVLTPFRAIGAMVDGDRHALASRDDLEGLHRHTLLVDVPPGAERTVVIDLTGEVEPGSTYRLAWFNQPLLNQDSSQLLIEPVGARFSDGSQEGRLEIGDERVADVTVSVGE
jgi:hypothetical protein